MKRKLYFFKKQCLVILLLCFSLCLSACQTAPAESTEAEESGDTMHAAENSALDTPTYTEAEENVVKIAQEVPVGFPADTMQVAITWAEEIEAQTNEYLKEKGREYTISIEVVEMDYTTFEQYSEYNIISGLPWDAPKSLIEENFLDLKEELVAGDLRPLYDSEPEVYWKSVEESGKIYNPITYESEKADAFLINLDKLEAIGISREEIEAFKGKEVGEWAPLFERIYELNGNVPFIENPMTQGASLLTPVLGMLGWNTHFQMVAPMIGISYEEPRNGAQFVLETEYATQVIEVWKSFQEKGYIINIDNTFEDIYPLFCLTTTTSMDILEEKSEYWQYRMVEEDEMEQTILICPLQSELSLRCRSAWDENGYSFLVPKDQGNLALTFQFMNDVAQDTELAAVSSLKDKRFRLIDGFAPSIRDFGAHKATYCLYPEERQKAAEHTMVPQDAGFMYNGAGLQKQVSYFDGVGFFTKMPLDTVAYSDLVMSMSKAEDWEEFDERLETVKTMYHEAGIDEVLEDINTQLQAYRQGEGSHD